MKKLNYNYKIYNPSGNITALVIGTKYLKYRKQINNEILKNNPSCEQVGFISTNKRKLIMAGGEFCGNAARCAINYYLKAGDLPHL